MYIIQSTKVHGNTLINLLLYMYIYICGSENCFKCVSCGWSNIHCICTLSTLPSAYISYLHVHRFRKLNASLVALENLIFIIIEMVRQFITCLPPPTLSPFRALTCSDQWCTLGILLPAATVLPCFCNNKTNHKVTTTITRVRNIHQKLHTSTFNYR